MIPSRHHCKDRWSVTCTASCLSPACGLAAGKRTNRKKKQVEVSETDALVEATDEDALVTVTRTKTQAKAVSNRPVFGKSTWTSFLQHVQLLPAAP